MNIEEQAQAAAEKAKADLLEDFPDIEGVMAKAAGDIVQVAVEYRLEDVIYKSLLTGATIISKKYREAQRIESELRDRCKTYIKN